MAHTDLSKHRFYKMDARPKGICLIINNFKFDESDYLETGPADGNILKKTFRKLGFDVKYCENLTGWKMENQMKFIQEVDHSKYDCFVCCISSHGNQQGVCGCDEKCVKVQELQSNLYASKCKTLAGKPKVFFVDACKGGENQEGIPFPRSSSNCQGLIADKDMPFPRSDFNDKGLIADKADFLTSYATTTANPAYCCSDSKKGSRYFCVLTQLLDKHAKSETVTQILQEVHSRMQRLSSKESLQTPEFRSTLTRELSFYPPDAGEDRIRSLQREREERKRREERELEERLKQREEDQKRQQERFEHLQNENKERKLREQRDKEERLKQLREDRDRRKQEINRRLVELRQAR